MRRQRATEAFGDGGDSVHSAHFREEGENRRTRLKATTDCPRPYVEQEYPRSPASTSPTGRPSDCAFSVLIPCTLAALVRDLYARIRQPISPLDAVRIGSDERAGNEAIIKRTDAGGFRVKADNWLLCPILFLSRDTFSLSGAADTFCHCTRRSTFSLNYRLRPHHSLRHVNLTRE